MRDSKKVILHLVFDGILFDRVSDSFNEMEGYDNIYLLLGYGDVEPFKYIKKQEIIFIAKDEEEWGNIISNPNIDIIYFHGMWLDSLKCFKYIRPNAIVIWWCYGMEIYEKCWGIAPPLPLKILKPRTYLLNQMIYKGDFRGLVSFNLAYLFPSLLNFIKKITQREQIIMVNNMFKRVDYLFTPLSLEYEELKRRHKNLKAAQFRLYPTIIIKELPVYHSKTEGILFDHSAVLTNNHLDILYALRKTDLSNRKVIFPLSYGNSIVREKIKSFGNFNGSETVFLEKPLPFVEYKKLLQTCSHAIFGTIRQTALGNIFLCFQLGIKIFFFKDSMLYKYFKKEGYYVYTIEDDMTQDCIMTPLTRKEVDYNNELYYKTMGTSHGSYTDQFNKLLEIHQK